MRMAVYHCMPLVVQPLLAAGNPPYLALDAVLADGGADEELGKAVQGLAQRVPVDVKLPQGRARAWHGMARHATVCVQRV